MATLKNAIRFQNADVKFSLKQKTELKVFLEKQLSKTAKVIRLDYIFCSDAYLLDINQRFLEHDYYTDIITFPLTSTKELLEAEIYISVDRVKDNAAKLNIELNDELLRVIFHGALHLVGYKDKTKRESLIMRDLEEKWTKAFKRSSNN